MDRPARGDISRGRAPGPPRAIYENNSRNAVAPSRSRHISEPAEANIFVDFAQDVIEFAVCDIALHLFIPVIVLPAVQPGSEFGTLRKRELSDGFLDLINAHEGES